MKAASRRLNAPLLFGRLTPVLVTETRSEWRSRASNRHWDAAVADAGRTWVAIWCGQRVGNAYASRAAAKRGLERFVVSQARVLIHAMGGEDSPAAFLNTMGFRALRRSK
jgi:hypothetical protein